MKAVVKIFAKTIEKEAESQINTLLETGVFDDCNIRVMPDVHSGAGCVIGFTSNYKDKIIPYIIGVDIGCGIRVVELENKPDSKHLQNIIDCYIPSGMDIRSDWNNIKPEYKKYRKKASDILEKLRCLKQLRNIGRLADSVGSLGGGEKKKIASGIYKNYPL